MVGFLWWQFCSKGGPRGFPSIPSFSPRLQMEPPWIPPWIPPWQQRLPLLPWGQPKWEERSKGSSGLMYEALGSEPESSGQFSLLSSRPVCWTACKTFHPYASQNPHIQRIPDLSLIHHHFFLMFFLFYFSRNVKFLLCFYINLSRVT